ncbi:unnamed protein product, partial [Effrenium voratum]
MATDPKRFRLEHAKTATLTRTCVFYKCDDDTEVQVFLQEDAMTGVGGLTHDAWLDESGLTVMQDMKDADNVSIGDFSPMTMAYSALLPGSAGAKSTFDELGSLSLEPCPGEA